MRKLGLIGYPLGHSFSKKYYLEKFQLENIKDMHYDLYSLADIRDFPTLFNADESFLGFNVTIPHKESVIPYLDELSEDAAAIQAVNCITIDRSGAEPYLRGFNTDVLGFEESLKPLLTENHTNALVLGNGGAAKAICYALKKLGITYTIVSRSKENGDITYKELTPQSIQDNKLIVNCSPLGTYPNIEEAPQLPYEAITKEHLLYDLIYNPEETSFLKQGRRYGAKIKNGYEMLVIQAERNWEIWNNV